MEKVYLKMPFFSKVLIQGSNTALTHSAQAAEHNTAKRTQNPVRRAFFFFFKGSSY